jgi:trk system potassium uptake protein TrkH
MPYFDAVCHSIAAIATGGFSTKNTGIAWFNNWKIEFILSAAMFIGGVTFLEIIKCFKSGFTTFYRNQQTRGYIKLVSIVVIIPIIITFITGKYNFTIKSFSEYTFQAIAAITTTSLNYSENSFLNPQILFLILGMDGGCSGSTSGGIKIFRIQVLYAILKQHIIQLTKPFDVNFPKYQGQRISENVITSVISFFVLLALTITVSALVLCVITDKSTSDCFHAVISCLFNIGYDVKFSTFSSFEKFVLIVDMILGRLEIIPIFVILSRSFWRR